LFNKKLTSSLQSTVGEFEKKLLDGVSDGKVEGFRDGTELGIELGENDILGGRLGEELGSSDGGSTMETISMPVLSATSFSKTPDRVFSSTLETTASGSTPVNGGAVTMTTVLTQILPVVSIFKMSEVSVQSIKLEENSTWTSLILADKAFKISFDMLSAIPFPVCLTVLVIFVPGTTTAIDPKIPFGVSVGACEGVELGDWEGNELGK